MQIVQESFLLGGIFFLGTNKVQRPELRHLFQPRARF